MTGKPLLPVLRTKKRYIVYRVISTKQVNHFDVSNTINNMFIELFGRINHGLAGIMNTKFHDTKKQTGIIKVNNKYLKEMKLTLTFIKKIKGIDAIVDCIYVSGILKKAKLKVWKGGTK